MVDNGSNIFSVFYFLLWCKKCKKANEVFVNMKTSLSQYKTCI